MNLQRAAARSGSVETCGTRIPRSAHKAGLPEIRRGVHHSRAASTRRPADGRTVQRAPIVCRFRGGIPKSTGKNPVTTEDEEPIRREACRRQADIEERCDPTVAVSQGSGGSRLPPVTSEACIGACRFVPVAAAGRAERIGYEEG